MVGVGYEFFLMEVHSQPEGTSNESDSCNGFQKFLIDILSRESMRIYFHVLCQRLMRKGGDVGRKTGKLEELSQNWYLTIMDNNMLKI